MAKLPEKGILKKHGYGAVDGKDKWGDDSQSEQLEAGSQSDGQEPAGAVADMEYKFKVRKNDNMLKKWIILSCGTNSYLD